MMYKYKINLSWSDEDNSFIAEVPELPGCMADGATADEALKNAYRVIDEWIETARELGRNIPEPANKMAAVNLAHASIKRHTYPVFYASDAAYSPKVACARLRHEGDTRNLSRRRKITKLKPKIKRNV